MIIILITPGSNMQPKSTLINFTDKDKKDDSEEVIIMCL